MANNADGSIIVDTEIDTTGFEVGSSELARATSGLSKRFEVFGERAKAAAKEYEKVLSGAAKNPRAIESSLDKAQQAAQRFREQLEGFKTQGFHTDDYKFIQDNIEKAETALERLLDRQAKMDAIGVKQNSSAYKSLQYEIEQARIKLNSYKADMEALKQEGDPAGFSGANTAQFEEYSYKLDRIEEQLEEMRDTANDAFTPPHVERWNNMVTLTGMIKNAFASIANAAAMVGMAVTHPLQSLDRLLGAIVSSALRAAHALGSMVKGAVVTGLHKLASAAKQAAVRLAQLVKQKVSNGLKSLGSHALQAAKSVLHLGKNAKKSNNGLQQGLKAILKYGLGIRTTYALINKLRRAIVSGFENLAQYSDNVNRSISSVLSSLAKFKNSLAAAFGPVVNAVAPALTRLIGLLSTATSKIGEFFAALSGQKSYTRAKDVQKDYAASLRDSSDAEKETAKNAKELERQLAGFDDLEILKASSGDNKEESLDSVSPGDMFEEVPIGNAVADFVRQLKDAFNAGDFAGIGELIAGKINDAFLKLDSYINWNRLEEPVSRYIRNFCDLFNSLNENINWGLIGKTFADGINTLLHAAKLLQDGINWRQIGVSISTALNSLVDNIDWDLLGKVLAGCFTTQLEIFVGAVETFDWENAGTKLAAGINSFVKKLDDTITGINWEGLGKRFVSGVNSLIAGVDWKGLGKSLANSFNAVVSVVYGIVTNFNWAGAATSLAAGFNSLVKNVDWAKLGETISNSFKGALRFIATAIEETDWQALGKKCAEFIRSIDWTGLTEVLCEGIGAALGGLAAFVWGLISEAWSSVVEWWYDAAYEDGEFTILGLLEGIGDALKNIGNWIKEHVFEPFINGFKKAFGISSPAKEMKPYGKYVIEGLLRGITDAWKSITSFFSSALSSLGSLISDAWTKMKNTASTAWSGIKNTIGNACSGIKDTTSSAASKVASTASTAWSNVKKYASDNLNAVKSNASNAWNSIKSNISSVTSSIASTVGSKFSSIGSTISSKVSSFKTTISNGFENAKNSITSKLSSAMSTIKNQGWTGVGTAICQGIKNGINSGWTWLKTTVSNLAKNLLTTAKNALGIHSPSRPFRKEVGLNIGLGVGAGVEDSEKSILKSVVGIAGAIASEFAAGDYAISPVVTGTGTSITGALDNFSGIITDKFAAMLEKMQAIANSVTFTLPAAADSVVPYSLSGSATSGGDDVTEALETSNEELISVLLQLFNNSTAAIVDAIRTYGGAVVNLDSNRIYQTVRDEHNRVARMNGHSELLI